jgi:hypothetical protein
MRLEYIHAAVTVIHCSLGRHAPWMACERMRDIGVAQQNGVTRHDYEVLQRD